MALPNAVRLIILLLTPALFIPQHVRIIQRRDCAGLSGYYLLFNLVSATHQLSSGLSWFLFYSDGQDVVVHNPPDLGDKLNLAQLVVVCGGHLISFIAYLILPPAPAAEKKAIVALYMACLLVSIGPIIFIATLPTEGGVYHDRSIPLAIFSMFSMYILIPASTALAAFAYKPQARELRERHGIGAVSVLGLLVQAISFVAIGITWEFRWVWPEALWGYGWYDFGGWAVLDNIVFAIVQGALWKIARRVELDGLLVDVGETEPLTGSS